MTAHDRATVIGALHREPRLQELLALAGQSGAGLLADVAIGYTHDGYVSRRGIVDALSLGVPPIFGEQVRRPGLLEAHAVCDVMDQVVAGHVHDQPDAHPASIEMDVADFAAQAVRMVAWAEAGTEVAVTRRGKVVARLVSRVEGAD